MLARIAMYGAEIMAYHRKLNVSSLELEIEAFCMC
jgi:hypothetical protein